MERFDKKPELTEVKAPDTPLAQFWKRMEEEAAVLCKPTEAELVRAQWNQYFGEAPQYHGGKHEGNPTRRIDGTAMQEARLEASDYPSTYEERIQQTPKEGQRGHWAGERGESEYTPTGPEIVKILDEYGLEGIEYTDGVPDFSGVSESTVEIDNMTENRDSPPGSNYEQCDEQCAEQWNLEGRDGKTDWSARDVADWRRENGYSWHERNDMKTCDLVPTKINAYFGHLGGVSECKKANSKDGGFDE